MHRRPNAGSIYEMGSMPPVSLSWTRWSRLAARRYDALETEIGDDVAVVLVGMADVKPHQAQPRALAAEERQHVAGVRFAELAVRAIAHRERCLQLLEERASP